MSVVLTFEPLPDSECQFEPTSIEVHRQDQVYIVGFPRHSLVSVPTAASPTPPNSPNSSGYDSECTRDGDHVFASRSNKHEDVANRLGKAKERRGATLSDLGFSNELVDDKLCIVPADAAVARKMRIVYAAILFTPGYKVLLFPSNDSKVYYQRAIPGNPGWKRISRGYSVDLADPLMTILDDAIHIKIDTRPDKNTYSTSGKDLLRKVLHFLRRSSSAPPSSLPTSSRVLAFPYATHPLIRQIHTEIDGTEAHEHGVRPYQIAAYVHVQWVDGLSERTRIAPEKGELMVLRKEREEKWHKERKKEVEFREERAMDRMEEEVNPFLDTKGKEASGDVRSSLDSGSEHVRKRGRDLPSIPESEANTGAEPSRESEQDKNKLKDDERDGDRDNDNTLRPTRPLRTRSNTTKVSSRSGSSSYNARSSSRERDRERERGRDSHSSRDSTGRGRPRERTPTTTSNPSSNPSSTSDRPNRRSASCPTKKGSSSWSFN